MCARLPLRASGQPIAHGSEAKVIRSRIEFSLATGGDIALAVLISAKKRSSAQHPLPRSRLSRIEAVGGALRIPGNLARSGQGLVVIGTVPIGSPLPDIAGHIE